MESDKKTFEGSVVKALDRLAQVPPPLYPRYLQTRGRDQKTGGWNAEGVRRLRSERGGDGRQKIGEGRDT